MPLRLSISAPTVIGSVAAYRFLLALNTAIDKPYYFTNAWIIDGASDKHVCNSPYRNNFTKTMKTDHRTIKCGRSVYPIECYGTCIIIAKTPDGLKLVTLNDVALCLYFRTNLISAAKMNDRGLHWITFIGEYICSEKNLTALSIFSKGSGTFGASNFSRRLIMNLRFIPIAILFEQRIRNHWKKRFSWIRCFQRKCLKTYGMIEWATRDQIFWSIFQTLFWERSYS